MDASDIKGKVDFGIITIRTDEFEAVLRRFSDAIGIVSGRRAYNLRRVVTTKGDAYTVAVIRCVEQGTGEVQDATRDLLDELSVQWLLAVGIAGGVPANEFTLGDVVVATRILDFGLEAVGPRGAREYAISGGLLDRTVTRIVANLPAMAEALAGWNEPEAIGMPRPQVKLQPRNIYGDKEWKKKVRSTLEYHFAQAAPRPPRVTTGTIASSDRLVKDDKLLASWLQSARQVLAVEMESAGIYRAAHGRGVPFLAIRGISDIVGFKRDPAFTEYACRSAAAFAYAFLKSRPIIPRESPVEQTALPAPILPPLAPRFTQLIGRDDLVEQLTSELLKDETSSIALVGPPGIGKSTLALAMMKRKEIINHYGENRWWVPLETATTADAALGLIASALGLSFSSNLRAQVRMVLGRDRSLLVLDNLETPWERDLRATEELLGDFVAISGLSIVVSVRGKHAPRSIPWGKILELQALDPEAARALFFEIAPEHRGNQGADVLLAPLGGVPLAITLLGYAAQGNDLLTLKREWEQRGTDLLEREAATPDRLSSWKTSIELSVASNRMIPEARRLAFLLAALPDGIAQEDLDEVFPVNGAQAARVLSQLGLIYFECGRLRQLPPIRIHLAREHSAEAEDLDWAMGWYGDLARSLGVKPGTRGGKEAVERLTPETANLDAMIRRGLASRDATLWIESAIALADFARFSGRLSLSLFELARERASALNDTRREAMCTKSLGDIAFARSERDLAEQRYATALALFRQIGDATSEANCIQMLGDIAMQSSKREAAQEHYETALRLYRQLGAVLGEANCILGLGNVALRNSQHDHARERYESAMRLYQQKGELLGQAHCIQSLGDIALMGERYEEAEPRYETARPLYRKVADKLDEADCIRKLGEIAAVHSQYNAATDKYEEALVLYRQIGNLRGEASCIRDLGVLALARSQLDEAEQRFQSALKLTREIDDRLGEANSIRALGELALERSNCAEAQAMYRLALALYDQISEPYSIGVTHRALARIETDPAERVLHVRAARSAWIGIHVLLAKLDKEFGAEVPHDRIAEIRIHGLRSIEALTLKLGKLTVLIGENGTGKSSIIEACELLRRASGPHFFAELHDIHGGLFNLLRDGDSELHLGARLEGEDRFLDYEIILSQDGPGAAIIGEQLKLDPVVGSTQPALSLIDRSRDGAKIHEPGSAMKSISIGPSQSILGSVGLFSPHPGITRMQRALEGIEVHLPFEVLPAWAAHAHDRRSVARSSALLQSTDRLECLGGNLANAFHTLRTTYGEEHWQTTMEYVRVGLGDLVESVNTVASEVGGAIALSVKIKGRDRQVPAAALADGAIAYLAFIALFRLGARNRTLLAFDEPELHLHPALLVRVIQFFEIAAETQPVLLATHSDRLLDTLRDPARAVRICELDDQTQQTRLRELDPEALEAWLEGYRGLGDLRGAGYLAAVLKPEDPA